MNKHAARTGRFPLVAVFLAGAALGSPVVMGQTGASGSAVIVAAAQSDAAPPADPTARPRPESPRAQALPRTMFGFEVGEERRYVLGPPEALVEGESAVWSITLTDINEARGRPFAAFDIGLESRQFGGPNLEQAYGRSLRARMIVNEAGFPGVVNVYERMNDLTLEYSYSVQQDETYRMEIGWPDNESTFPIPIPTHRNLDLATQTGLYLFVNGQDLRGDLVKNFVNNMFANPGLLSLAMPSPLPESGWETEILAFAPGEAIPRFPDGNFMRFLGRRSDVRNNYFSRIRLRTMGAEEIEIGGRTVDGIRLDVRGPYRRAFVDADGRMLLLEHESLDTRRPRHIRLLWPSEY